MASTSVRLARTGQQMPLVGLGTWKAEKGVVAAAVEKALKMGYRHLDCACDYGNEQEVGTAIKKCIDEGVLKREELFVTSKLWNTFHATANVRPACQKTLADLGLDYVDLYLIHFPISLKHVPIEVRYPPEWVHDPAAGLGMPNGIVTEPVPIHETWAAMELLVEEGLAKNIGISNFNCALTMDLLKYAKTKPAVNQVELHPFLQQPALVKYCQANGIVITAYSPLGSPSYDALFPYTGPNLLEMEEITGIARAHGKTAAQVLLRWNVQRGCVVIPKSTKRERLQQNMDLFDFMLSEAEMAAIAKLDCSRRFNNPEIYARLPIFG